MASIDGRQWRDSQFPRGGQVPESHRLVVAVSTDAAISLVEPTLVEAAFTTMLIYKHAEQSIGCIVRGVLCCGEFELNVKFETSLGVVLFSVDREIS
jgi:hypothetical protein